MNFQAYQQLVNSIKIGKHLPEAIYLHKTALIHIDSKLLELTYRITKSLKIPEEDWNLAKFSKRDYKLSLLSYPTFHDEPYPPLHKSYSIDLAKLSLREANYRNSDNPPILHRRETFFDSEHPQNDFFKSFTTEGEEIGLYKNTRTIGFQQSWRRLIAKKGYYLDDDGHLKKIIEKPTHEITSPFNGSIERHKTAISRDKLSVPMFLIAQRGFLNGSYSILDYGCGRGDDLRELEANQIDCIGWDPVHKPDTDLESCDIVNLGFVINVIEDKVERIETLQRAYEFADKLIMVSAMLGNERVYERFKAYKDGVITSRNTFQKYYAQGELKNFIESSLNETAIALAPGVFAVFKDKIEEQSYLLERQKTRYQWRQLSSKPQKEVTIKKTKELFDNNHELFQDFWQTTLDLGRLPANDEFEQSLQLRQVAGSLNKALTVCKKHLNPNDYLKSQKFESDNLLVYFALSFFKKRDAYIRMPQSIQRSVKAFFGNYSKARELGKELLYEISDSNNIYDACIEAHKSLPACQLNGQHDLILHKDFLNMSPKLLRVYVGCALHMYGELNEVSLIKIHITSGKVSLMVYDDWNKDTPLLRERIKIKMRDQDIDFFDYYGEFKPLPLLNKQDFLAHNEPI